MSQTLFKVVKSHAAPNTGPRAADWRDAALCRSDLYDPELWFPKGTDAASVDAEQEAVRICRRCPAMAACRDWAIKTRQDHGVWGGLTAQDRADLRRHGRIPKKRTPIQAFASIQDAYEALTRKDGRHVIWTGGNEVRIGSVRMSPNQVAWRARRKTSPVGRVFPDCETDGCVRHLNDQAMRQERDVQKRETATCGTRSGYQRHRRLGEAACDPCRQANADADHRLRNTGTTTERSAA